MSTRRARLILATQAVLLLYGVCASLRIVLETFGFEPDTSHSLMLWYGVRDHGLAWIASWVFTQDNWLLSLVPFHFLGYAIFGPSPWVSIGMGWAIFVLSALVCAAIASRLGARRAAPFVCVALLNLGLYAHLKGYAAYSTSHNVTNLFGLTSVLVLVHWEARPRFGLLVLLLLLLTSGAVSDPWMLASFNLPIVCAGLTTFIWPSSRIPRPQSVALMAVAAFSMIATKTKFFGALGFLPGVEFVRADWAQFNANGIFAIRDVGGLLNIVPTPSLGAFVPGVLTLLAVIAFAQWRTTTLIRERRLLVRLPLPFIAFVLSSIGGIVAALMLSGVDADLGSSRFLLNCLYLVVIVVAVLSDAPSCAGPSRPNDTIARRCGITFFALFLLSSFVTTIGTVARPGFTLKASGVDGIATFLRSEGLTYGYGPYWGSLSNAVTALTRDGIRIRPVMFNRRNGELRTGRPETSRRWYDDDDIPAGTRRFFVIVKDDGEECPAVATCIAGLHRQFGAPVETIEKDDLLVLVWDHPLLRAKAPPQP